MRLLVTGGAGFIGSHLCERLLDAGHHVICLDTFATSDGSNIAAMQGNPRFELCERDVVSSVDVSGPIHWVVHLASPASPQDYLSDPIAALEAGSIGTLNCLRLAHQRGAGFLLSSSSEAYGDPLVHPQPETYWGNVDPVGPRGAYAEAKRFSEAAAMAYRRRWNLRVCIARIFNTFGPRMRRSDGRVIPTFVAQALSGRPITVHGSGLQTRSLCYVSDTVEALIRLILAGSVSGPINIGTPNEVSVLEIAERVRSAAGSSSPIVFTDQRSGDPRTRCPDISRASQLLGWAPTMDLEDGLARTIAWCRIHWAPLVSAEPTSTGST
jgi:nucleoside-diphosphate-sugar epimerase